MRSASTIAKAQTRPNTNFGGRILRYCATWSFTTVVTLVVLFITISTVSPKAQAVTNSTINFQARILQSSGALVPDGDYNVEFKIYDSVNLGASGQGTCSLNSTTDDCWWVETRTGADVVRVVNGYVAVNLGSVTPFGAGIPWDQDLYITMRVGGIGGPVWDTEMVNATTGRMKFNASPYAFQAGGLKVTSGANSTTVNFASPTATNTITFGDESGTVCIQNSASCGFATGSGTAFLQGGNSFGATANLGTTDANILNLRTDSLVRVSIDANGEVILGSNLLTVTPSTSRVQVGSLTTDSTAINFVIDSYDQATDPSGQNGAMYYNTSTNRFRCYQDGGWVDCIGGAPYTGTTATLVGGLQNVVANQTALPIENMVFTTNTAVSTVGASGGFTAPADGSFRSCLVQNTANITAGTLSLRWRVNGVSVGSVACLMDNTAPNNREVSEVLNPGSVTFQAGDIIDVAFDTSVTFAPTGTNDFTVYWGVEYIAGGGGSGSGGVTLQDVYDQSLVSEMTTANNKDITFNLANTAIDSNFVVNVEAGSSSRFVLQNAGADTFSVNATGDVTASGGLTVGNSSSVVAGTIRWTGTDFEGYDGASWVSLTSGSGGGGIGQNMVSRVKQANESVISNIVPQDDNELTFPIGPNEEWSYRFVVQANAAAAADMRFAVTAPVGAVCNTATSEAENSASDAQVGCGVSSAILNGNATPELYEITGSVINGSTAGNITLQWAQFTSNATNTIVYAGSYVQATRSIGAGGSGQPFAQSGNAFGTTAVLGTSDNNALSIITNGTEKIRIDASGNIGIGDGTPVALFTVGTADAFQVNASGNVLTSGTLSVAGTTTLTGNLLAGNSATLTTGTTTGTGANTTTLDLTADVFAVNDVVLIDNAGQDYYTRVTVDPGTGSYTVSPAVTFENTRTVTKYNIQNIGASTTDYTTTANRFFQGYFLGGITVGAGSTTLADGVLSRTVGDIVITPGSGGEVNINGTVNATAVVGDGSGITNIDSSAIDGATITGIDASNISAGTLNDTRLSSNVALLNGSASFVSSVSAASFAGDGSALTTLNGSNISSGTVADARLSTNIAQLSGAQIFSGSKTFDAGLTIGATQTITIDGQSFSTLDGTGLTNSSGSLSVSYGSSAGTAVEGSTTITCPAGTGNLTGGGNTITLGSGGTCSNITTNNAASFSTSVTSPLFTGAGAVTLGSGGAGDLTLDSASNVLVMSDATLRRIASGTTTLELNDAADTTLSIFNTDGASVANLSVEGLVSAASLSGDGSLITAINGTNISTGTLADGRLSSNVALLNLAQSFSALKTFGAGATITTGQTFTVNGEGFTDLTGNGLTLSGSSLAVAYGSSANTAVEGNTGITITAGTGISGGGSITLGTGGSVSLDIDYGSLAGTAVQGNTTLTCPSGTGNLTGGGTSITLGTGGTCGAISTNNAVAFTTSVTSPIFTSSGAISLTSGGANTVTIDAGGASTIDIAGTNATAVNIGRTTGVTTVVAGASISLSSGAVSTVASTVSANSVTTGTAMQISATALTTGNALDIVGPGSRSLLRVQNNTSDPLDDQRVIIGQGGLSVSKPDALARDQLYVFGRINYSWNMYSQDFVARNQLAQATADAALYGAVFDEATGAAGGFNVASVAAQSGTAVLDNPTSPAANENEWFGTGGVGVTERSLNPVFEARILGTNNNDHRIIAGFADIALNGANSADTNQSANEIFFRKNQAATVWQVVTRTASGVETTTNTAIATNAYHTLRIEVDNVTPRVLFVIDGTVVATHNTALPASGTRLGWYIGNALEGAVNRATNIDYVRVWSDDPPEDSIIDSINSSDSLDGEVTSESSSSAVTCLSDESACPFVRIAADAIYQDSSDRDSLAINKTANTGNLIRLQRDASDVLVVSNNGGLTISAQSGEGLTIRNGDASVFSVNPAGKLVRVGQEVATADPILFVLSASTDAEDPEGTNGAQYYNASTNRFRCFENGEWRNCIGGTTNAEFSLLGQKTTWINVPESSTELLGNEDNRAWIDMSFAREFRVTYSVNAMNESVQCNFEFSSNNGTDWISLTDTSHSIAFNMTGLQKSEWYQLRTQAKGEVLVRAKCASAQPDTNLELGNIKIQLR